MQQIYVVTAFDKSKNIRATVSKPLSKLKANKLAKSLANDMLIAKPADRSLSKIRVEQLIESNTCWEDCYSSELEENFVIHLS